MEQTVRILLIEDDPDYALLMSSYVNAACGASVRYVLVGAETLADGLARLREEDFDVALLDLMLPDSKGMDTLRRVRAAAPGVPLVVLTNLDQEDIGREAIANGAQDFLSKSRIDAGRLRNAIAYALERERLFGQMRALVDGSPDGIVIVDRAKAVRYANPAAAALFGRPREGWVGAPFEHPLEPGQAVRLRLTPEPGREVQAELRCAEIEWKGRPAWMATVRDVSELTKLEEARAEVRERVRMDQLKDQLLSTVAHELRSPLSVVKAVVATLRDRLAGPLTDEQGELIHNADRNIDRLNRLLNNFLDLSRLESRQARVSRQAVDPVGLVREIAEGVRMANRGRPVVILYDLPETAPPVHVDADMMAQVLANLLENALRYARARVLVRATAAPSHVEVSVVDDGPGIPPDRFADLFNKFVQLDRPRGGSGYKGTGLGLAICREIVALNDGKIWAENAAGRGACFRFTMPFAAAESEREETPHAGTGIA